jgi:hypothetical protein
MAGWKDRIYQADINIGTGSKTERRMTVEIINEFTGRAKRNKWLTK